MSKNKHYLSNSLKNRKFNYENNYAQIENFIKDLYPTLFKTLKKGGKIMICGNGGSASDANHFAAELSGKFKSKKRALLPCLSLTSNTSNLTAIANDFNFEQIFSKLVESYGNNNDILICLSTSGKSKNIIKAIEVAVKKKIIVIGLFGRVKYEYMKKINYCLNINSIETAIIQELHYLSLHLICELLENDF